MNTNPPNDPIYFEGNHLPVIINIQKSFKKGLVRTRKGKTFPVTLQDWLLDGIQLYDYVELKKYVTGEWFVTDYHVNMEVYGAIHNSYQEQLPEQERDYIYNEQGELYE